MSSGSVLRIEMAVPRSELETRDTRAEARLEWMEGSGSREFKALALFLREHTENLEETPKRRLLGLFKEEGSEYSWFVVVSGVIGAYKVSLEQEPSGLEAVKLLRDGSEEFRFDEQYIFVGERSDGIYTWKTIETNPQKRYNIGYSAHNLLSEYGRVFFNLTTKLMQAYDSLGQQEASAQ